MSVDSTTYSGNGNTVSGYENRTITIFNRNNYVGVRAVFDNSLSRLYSSKYYRDGILIQHLIPVRVGTEGAAMDTLTRRIYRNAGTGAFGYGNDLKYPIPAA